VSPNNRYVIGGRTDRLSSSYQNRTVEALRESNPKLEFASWHDRQRSERHGGDHQRDFGWLLQTLVKGEIDILVVDAREVPLRQLAKVEIGAVTRRANPYDVFVSRSGTILDELPEKSCLAVDIAVRKGQLLFYRPDLAIIERGGDFESYYDLLETDKISGFVYTAADVEALNKQDKVAEVFTSSICMPVAGQGAQVLLVRKDDREALMAVGEIGDLASAKEIELERAFITCIAKNGKGPIGVLVSVEGDSFKIEAAVVAPDGCEKVSGNSEGGLDNSEAVLERLAGEMLESGARDILKSLK
jgi:hydroxymethylbilane synthase